MKIGIDGTALTIPFPCGTKNYAINLIKNLAIVDKKNEYRIFAPKRVNIPKQSNFRFIKIYDKFPILKRQIFLTHAVKKECVDLFHYLGPGGSIFLRHPNIITTVHDLRLKYTYPWLSKYFPSRLYLETCRFFVLKRSSLIITQSRAIKREVQNLLKKKYIKVIPISHNDNFSVIKELKKDSNSKILCFADFARRKNIKRVLEAYSKLPSLLKIKCNLQIICSTDTIARAYLKLAKHYKIQNKIDLTVQPTNNDLVKIYNQAIVLVYPSLYEGFGIPILEAMACGCPVITSNFGAMKEVSGNAAYMISPYSIKNIIKALTELIQNTRFRNSLIEKGIKRANEFSWKKCAVKTLNAYTYLYKNNKVNDDK